MNGPVTEGLVTTTEPLINIRVYIDNPMNIIGFRNYLPHYNKVDGDMLVECFELGYFMNLLYEGSYKAFKCLHANPSDILYDTLQSEVLRKNSDKFLSYTLVDSLIKDAEDLMNNLEEDPYQKITGDGGKFLIEKLAYNNRNAYICMSKLIVAYDILKEHKFTTPKDTNTLQGIYDGMFSYDAIKDGYTNYKNKVDEIYDWSDLPSKPDLEEINTLLLNIRNVDITTLNIYDYEKSIS